MTYYSTLWGTCRDGKIEKMRRWIIGLLLVIFGGIVLHAPLSVGFSTLFPGNELLIRSWKEVLLLIVGVLVLVELRRQRAFGLLRDPLFLFIGLYALLHLALLPILWQGLLPSLAGLMIDLRYVLFFSLVYLALKLYPGWRQWFVRVGIVGALVVSVFGVLQVTVLPYDALKYIGYDKATNIAPYLTVDENYDYIRINSTLRGPNPLGAYMAIVLAGVAAYVWKKRPLQPRAQVIAGMLAASAVVCLWSSHSRSAWLAAAVALAIVAIVVWGRRIPYRSRKLWLAVAGGVIALVTISSLVISTPWGHTFVANTILHDNPTTGAELTSNDGHLTSLQEAGSIVSMSPLGMGVGSTGSASLLGDSPIIIENQFLYIGHEVGWLGLVIFVLIVIGILSRLWQARADWLALTVFASGVGMLLIALLLPVWVDDTVSLIWWGLAGVALAVPRETVTKRRRT